ncbi:chemotaxis response regulator protein-glutamate methylesterase [Saccharibacillus sp. JS10]|uniref:protein-glutamate methylesterase/protein-glutamine glutaminase n=1 Tax=Saccharibacillus sp. JS10 TaxID=2950552 RepID=UPI00210D6844|nr:chemotaxis response regulator protein-glutamate methylesterase [Saccharibacillus sp. JS10]MCQ4087208.1 chemotaxis response regulator protein-glutamate methylesterase [Saccharibacillus sp. JS10]
MTPYRVLVVDDSAFMRKIVSDLIERDVSFAVVDTAKNGIEAVEKIKKLKPDIVTMDVEMPEMNGLESLQHIMREYPLPVIMLSGINEEGMRETIMALEAGAFDFIRKPSVSNSQDIEAVGEALLRQLHAAVHDSAWRKDKKPTLSSTAIVEDTQSQTQDEELKVSTHEKRQPEERAFERPRRKIDPPASEARPQKNVPSGSAPVAPQRNPIPTAKPKPSVSPVPPASASLNRPIKTNEEKKLPTSRSSTSLDKKPISTEPVGSTSKPLTTTPKTQVTERKVPERPVVPPASGNRASGGEYIDQIVAVGCSTGGPRALKELLENIPASFPAPIVIVQHMPPKFTHSLAQRLNTLSPLEVVEAEHGMPLRKGTAYIAPGGHHLMVKRSGNGQYAIELSDAPPQNGHKPSVGAMFDSLLPMNDIRRHAVIMTGMGSDGAKEMKKLYDSGVSTTIAESEETCVVYGMPRSAAELNCVMHLLPLPQIATKLNQVVKS